MKGDVHVIRFVSDALNHGKIFAEEAERLVHGTTKNLGIAPRLLDYEIWKYVSGTN